MDNKAHKFYNCTATLANGTIINVNANWLHNTSNDYWLNWKCNAGVDRLYISSDGSVYGSECKNNLLGNIDTEWNLLDSPTICSQERCTGCTDDLLITKEISNVV